MSQDAIPQDVMSTPQNGAAIANEAEGFWKKVRGELGKLNQERAGGDADVAVAPARNWMREYGRYLIVGGVVLGLAFPGIAAAVKGLLPALIVISLILSVAQANVRQIAKYSSKSMMVIGLLIALLVLAPALITIEAKEVLVPYGLPITIAEGMILAALAPPMMAASGIAFLLGLDSILALVCSLVAHILCPISIALLSYYLIGPDIALSTGDLVQRLAVFIGVGFGIGLLLRGVGISRRVEQSKNGMLAFDAISVTCLALLALGLMDGVSTLAILDPQFALWAFGCGLVLNPLLQFLGASLFMKAGADVSLTVGMLAGYRNTALLIVVLAGAVDPKILVFLAIVQVPTFIMPMLSEPVLRWVRELDAQSNREKA